MSRLRALCAGGGWRSRRRGRLRLDRPRRRRGRPPRGVRRPGLGVGGALDHRPGPGAAGHGGVVLAGAVPGDRRRGGRLRRPPGTGLAAGGEDVVGPPAGDPGGPHDGRCHLRGHRAVRGPRPGGRRARPGDAHRPGPHLQGLHARQTGPGARHPGPHPRDAAAVPWGRPGAVRRRGGRGRVVRPRDPPGCDLPGGHDRGLRLGGGVLGPVTGRPQVLGHPQRARGGPAAGRERGRVHIRRPPWRHGRQDPLPVCLHHRRRGVRRRRRADYQLGVVQPAGAGELHGPAGRHPGRRPPRTGRGRRGPGHGHGLSRHPRPPRPPRGPGPARPGDVDGLRRPHKALAAPHH